MTKVHSGKVLVTGATGYIAEWIVQLLLEQGYFVRGTVRSEAKGASLKEIFAAYGDRFEHFLVEDMTKEGAFDDVVKDVDAVLHVASPVSAAADDPDELIGPAVAGTLNILESTHKFGDAVQRVVVTSSCAAVYTNQTEFRVFNEEDWNTFALKEVETKGREASHTHKYHASKIRAERAVWKFLEEHKGQMKFDVVVITPPGVFGPFLRLKVNTLDEVNGSMKYWVDAVFRAPQKTELQALLNAGGEWVDVRDIAQAHVLALQNEDVGGHRIIVAAGPYKFHEWVNIAHSICDRIPVGNALNFDPANPAYTYRFDTSKAAKFFNIQYRSKEECTKDVLAQLEKNNLLP